MSYGPLSFDDVFSFGLIVDVSPCAAVLNQARAEFMAAARRRWRLPSLDCREMTHTGSLQRSTHEC